MPEFNLVQRGFDGVLRRASPAISAFYRACPYQGPHWFSEVDTRGAFSQEDRFFFNRIPKSANSTITSALVAQSAARSGRVVKNEKWYFDRPLSLKAGQMAGFDDEVFKFTFVRNPYSRVLSAFLDKVLGKKSQSRGFYRWWQGQGNGAGRVTPDFLDFCHYLSDGGLNIDIHWAPQVDILLLPPERFDFIGRFEALDQGVPLVLERIFGQAPTALGRSGPRSDANAAMDQHYTDESRAMIATLYAGDIAAFGYEFPTKAT